jgi:hypothetical protein
VGARRDCEEAISTARETSQPWSQSIALRIHAETLLAGACELAAAEDAARAAILIQEQRECRCDLAWSRLTLCRVLQAKTDFEGAMTELLAASRAFEDMGIARGVEKASSVMALLSQPRAGAPESAMRAK